MKHIKKKYHFQGKLEEDVKEFFNDKFKSVDVNDKAILKNHKNDGLLLQTDDDLVLGFIHNYHGEYITIPLPDITLIYFDFAYNLDKVRKDKEKELFTFLTSDSFFSESSGNQLYSFYGSASAVIICLFTSIESYINNIIPDKGIYKRVSDKKTELFDKNQIQENLSFDEKLKKVLPFFYNKKFFDKNTPTNQHIINLKNLRDEIIHTKSGDVYNCQVLLFKMVINFNYIESFDSVAKFFNFYKPNYIEECNCGKDF